MLSEVGQMSEGVSNLAVTETTVVPKYDDPYEENPIAAKCLHNCAEERSPCDDVTACDSASTQHEVATGTCRSTVESEWKSNSDVGCIATPMRSFELSAEYAGFFVDPAATATEQSGESSTAQQSAETVQPLPSRAAESSVTGAGLYDEPWDLSTVKHNIEEQLRESSQHDAVIVNCRPTMTADVYAQPVRRDRQPHGRTGGSRTTDPRVTDSPCYGVLCQRISDDAFVAPPPPPLAQRRTSVRSNDRATWTTDSRPLDDYDVPWDQKKKLGGRTSKMLNFSHVETVIYYKSTSTPFDHNVG